MIQQFPFGQPLRCVQQTDRTPKRVFVLGVYASAVHARWMGPDKKEVVKALAVASEPYIFWKGDGAAGIIEQISIPPELGTLEPADAQFNGPSGIALDELFLKPLGLERADAWLCNLIPHSCINTSQQKAIAERYTPIAGQYGLPVASVPEARQEELADARRRAEIISELHESEATTLIVLGDQPIKWFLNKVGQPQKRLSDFKAYGHLHSIRLDRMKLNVLPLVHPRQAAMLGAASQEWFDVHDQWTRSEAGGLGL